MSLCVPEEWSDLFSSAPVIKQPQATLLIIVWRPNVISVINGDTPMMSAIFGSVVDDEQGHVVDNCPINPLSQSEA